MSVTWSGGATISRSGQAAVNEIHPDRELWTSADVARTFRVGVSSIKRWSDDGLLPSVKTPGGHRRYRPTEVYRFAVSKGMPLDLLPPTVSEAMADDGPPPRMSLIEALRTSDEAVIRRVIAPPREPRACASFLDLVVGDTLREIGELWERGECGVDDEHRASHVIADSLDRQRPPLPRGVETALLACPPGEWHELPLRMLRLVLELSGWKTEYAGASLPWEATVDTIESIRPRLLLFTARGGDPFRTSEFLEMAEECRERGTTVCVGGEWARGGTRADLPYLRFRTLRGFARWLSAQRRRAA